MEELSKKYYRIREVSELINEPASTLRYWESVFPQLKIKRNEKGTRFYTPRDITTLRKIKYLLTDKGLKIEAAAEQLNISSDSVAAKQNAIDRLLTIREALVNMRDALHRLR